LEISRSELSEMGKTHPHIKEVLQNHFRKRVLDLFLRLAPLFSSLTTAEREEILRRFRLRRIAEGTLLFEGGDPPGSLYMIKSGEVEIFSRSRQGKRVVLARYGSGNIFGELGPFFNKPRVTSAEAIQPTELLELTKEDLEVCLQQCPKLQSILKEISFQHLTRINEIFSQEKIEKVKEGMV
jgi:CRP-like cAMP-binding protein